MTVAWRNARRATTVTALLAGSATLAASPAAGLQGDQAALTLRSRITPDSVGPLRIGMTLEEARAASGVRITYAASKAGDPTVGQCGQARVRVAGMGLSMLMTGPPDGEPRIRYFDIRRRGLATRRLVRVGDSVRRLRTRYRGRLVSRRQVYTPHRQYELRDGRGGKVIFFTDDRRVTLMYAGRRPHVDYPEGCA